jgi:uncharacterized protein YcbX
MVVDADGECVTARTDRRLFTIVGETPHTVAGLVVPLRLSAPDHGAIDVAEPASDAVPVTVFGRAMTRHTGGRRGRRLGSRGRGTA